MEQITTNFAHSLRVIHTEREILGYELVIGNYTFRFDIHLKNMGKGQHFNNIAYNFRTLNSYESERIFTEILLKYLTAQ